MMTFDDTIRGYAMAADNDSDFYDEADDNHDDLRHRFDDDDEEEEITLTSDDDTEDDDRDADNDVTERPDTHAEEASLFSLPPSPAAGYTPATREATLPVRSEASTTPAQTARSVNPAAKAAKKAPAKKAA